MIDHVTINVRDLAVSRMFYEQILGTLGMRIMLGGEEEQFWGFSATNDPELEISVGRLFVSQSDEEQLISPSTHIAFKAKDHEMVDRFYEVGLTAGGRDNGAPGLRSHYGPTYYAAFILDPDGNNIEACTYKPSENSSP
jgi:catechol 2,3-dioxygenase-like lactoylglutathione lyase family enzyme